MLHIREFIPVKPAPHVDAGADDLAEPVRGPRGLLFGLAGGAALWMAAIAAALLLR